MHETGDETPSYDLTGGLLANLKFKKKRKPKIRDVEADIGVKG